MIHRPSLVLSEPIATLIKHESTQLVAKVSLLIPVRSSSLQVFGLETRPEESR